MYTNSTIYCNCSGFKEKFFTQKREEISKIYVLKSWKITMFFIDLEALKKVSPILFANSSYRTYNKGQGGLYTPITTNCSNELQATSMTSMKVLHGFNFYIHFVQ